MKHSVQVSIAGHEYPLRTELTPEEARQVADFVNARIDEVAAGARGADSRQQIVLAFLKVAAAYLDKDRHEGGLLPEVMARIEGLAGRLEEKLSDDQPVLDFEGTAKSHED